MDFSHTIQNGVAIERMLKEFPKAIQKNIASGIVNAGGQVLVKEIRKNIKAKTTKRTGNLIKGVKKRKRRGLPHRVLVYMGAPAYHSHLVEYGTVQRRPAQRKGKRTQVRVVKLKGQLKRIVHTGRMTATPFFRPAVDESHQLILAGMQKYAGKRILKEALKLSGKYRTMKKTYRRKLAA